MKEMIVKFADKYMNLFPWYLMNVCLPVFWMAALAYVIWPVAAVGLVGFYSAVAFSGLPLIGAIVLVITASFIRPDFRPRSEPKSWKGHAKEVGGGFLYIIILYLASAFVAAALDVLLGIPFDQPRFFALVIMAIFTPGIVNLALSKIRPKTVQGAEAN